MSGLLALGCIFPGWAGEAVSDPAVRLVIEEADGSRRETAFPVSVVRVENRNGLLNFAFTGPEDMIFQVNGLKVPEDHPRVTVPGTAYQLVLMNTPWAEEAFTGPVDPDSASRCSWLGQAFPRTLSGEAAMCSSTGRRITASWSVRIHAWPAAQVTSPRRSS